jgi:two-component system, cell cycle response regulator CtrA
MKVLTLGLDAITLEFLRLHGFVPEVARPYEDVESSEDLVNWLRDGAYDACIVDLEESGLGILFPRVLRTHGLSIPVVGLGNRDQETAAQFLEQGGDYLVPKPANPRLLVACLRSSNRRIVSSHVTSAYEFTGVYHGEMLLLSIDTSSLQAKLNGMRLELTQKELMILIVLATRANKTHSKESIMSRIYNQEEDDPDIKIIDVFICKLRRKLGDTALGGEQFVRTEWGMGYMLQNNWTISKAA